MADLGPDDYIYYCVEMTVPANIIKPTSALYVDVDVIYDPSGGVADSDLKYRFGADDNPTNDTDPGGGAIDTGVDVDDDTSGNLISALTIVGTDQTYRGIAARQNKHATGSFTNAKVANRAGGNPPTASNVFTIYSTSASDTGPIHLIFEESSVFVEEDVTLNGTSSVISSNQIDASSHWVAIYDSGATPVGDIYLEVDGEIVGVIYGSLSGYGGYLASSLYRIALCTAQNTALSFTNRKTDPASNLGSYSRATYWPGNDSSIAVPA